MSNYRPTPDSYYYSGQGRLAMGDRDSTTGAFSNVVFLGNVTSLQIDLASDKFEHKESMSGNRAIDLTVAKEKKPTFKFTAESLSLELLATGLYGTSGTETAGTVADEPHTVKLGAVIPLKHPNVYSVVVTKVTGSVVLVAGTDYEVDGEFGTIYPLDSADVADADDWTIDYSYATYKRADAFMQGLPPEKYLRFEGLNTVNGDLRLIEIPRGALDPLTGLQFINDEVGNGEFSGNILQDTTITTPGISQYFTEKRMVAGTNHA